MSIKGSLCFVVNPKFEYGDTVIYHGQKGVVNGQYSINDGKLISQIWYYVDFGYGLDAMCLEENLELCYKRIK